MKLTKIFYVALMATFAISCENEMWSTEQPVAVDVLNIYDIRDVDNELELEYLDIYQNKPLLICKSDKSVLTSFEMLNYVDNSDASSYDISFTVEDYNLSTGELTTHKEYKIYGTVAAGFIYLDIVDYLPSSDEDEDEAVDDSDEDSGAVAASEGDTDTETDTDSVEPFVFSTDALIQTVQRLN